METEGRRVGARAGGRGGGGRVWWGQVVLQDDVSSGGGGGVWRHSGVNVLTPVRAEHRSD